MALRDKVAITPALDCRMTAMIQSAGQSPNAAAIINPFAIVGHTHLVRTERTKVNLENVPRFWDYRAMTALPSTGTKLLALKQRSGLSLRAIAAAAGYKGASSIQRYFSADYDSEYLPPEVAERLAKVFMGKGRPAIMADEVTDLAAYAPTRSASATLAEQTAIAFVWHVARQFGATVDRDDPEVLRLARFLQALLRLLAAHEASNGTELVDGLFAGAALEAQTV
jgi:hypothetical protein